MCMLHNMYYGSCSNSASHLGFRQVKWSWKRVVMKEVSAQRSVLHGQPFQTCFLLVLWLRNVELVGMYSVLFHCTFCESTSFQWVRNPSEWISKRPAALKNLTFSPNSIEDISPYQPDTFKMLLSFSKTATFCNRSFSHHDLNWGIPLLVVWDGWSMVESGLMPTSVGAVNMDLDGIKQPLSCKCWNGGLIDEGKESTLLVGWWEND